MKQTFIYSLYTMFGIMLNNFLLGLAGYHQLSIAETLMAAKFLEAIIAISIAPEGYSYGLHSSRHHWAARWARLLFWLTIGLVLRAAMLYYVAGQLGLEHPSSVASGMLATDPAGVSLALGFAEPAYLTGLFWQLGVESQINDAAGIAAYGLLVEKLGWAVGSILSETVISGLMLAVVQTLIRRFLRRNGRSRFELRAVVATYLVFIVVGVVRGHSLILMSAVGSIVADRLGSGLHLHEEVREKVLHQWERLNLNGLGLILMLVASLAPFRSMNGAILFNGFILMLTVGLNRALVEFIKRGALHLFTGKPGRDYGYAAGVVNWLAGWTMLGVPTIIALLTGAHGDLVTGDSMYTAVVISILVIVPTVLAIRVVEAWANLVEAL